MRLYLFRHGDAASHPVDADRPLSEEGVASVCRVASFLKRSHQVSVDRIVHSSLLRARQTAGLIAKELGVAEVEQAVGMAPEDRPDRMLGEIQAAARDLMLVGHMPHLGRLASLLVGVDPDLEMFAFPKAGVLCLVPKDEDAHSSAAAGGWAVKWMISPRLVSDLD